MQLAWSPSKPSGMSRRIHGASGCCVVAIVAAILQACAARPVPTLTELPVTSTATLAVATLPQTQPQAASNRSLSPPLASGTPSAPKVTVTATNGNLFIRRGPDLGFNPIAALLSGQTATGLARDVLSEWIEVPLPGQPNQTGWVSIQTQFTTISGELSTLPEVQPDYWPVGATIRNCTLHQMLITPVNIILPSVDNFPANDVRVNPGTLVVVDTDVDGYPEVMKVEIREGSAVDVRVDGNGLKKKCPTP